MTQDEKRIRRRVTLTLIGLPILIAFFVVGGVLFGFYLSDVLLSPNRIVFPLVFATVGLAISIVASYIVAKKVA